MPETPASALPAATRRWRQELVAAAGRDALLDYEDLPTGTLDLATAHPSGLAQFLAGRPTRLSSLFREPGALTAARRRARAIRLAAVQLADQHGVAGSYLVTGMVTWPVPGRDRPVQAPVLLRPLTLRPRGAGQVDDDLDLGEQVRVNPALVSLLAEHGARVDPDELVALAVGEYGFNPRPALAALRAAAGRLDGFEVSDRTVVGIFVDVVPALLTDLDAVRPALAAHPVAAALAAAQATDADPGAGTPDGGAPDAGAPDAGAPDARRDEWQVPLTVPFAIADLDRDQRRVLHAVSGGTSLRVVAPPGTGATRLLTQLVVTQAGAGRRTLLVSAQRAELLGVREALAAVGLAQLVRDPAGLLVGARARRPDVGDLPDLDRPTSPPPPLQVLRSLAEQRSGLHQVTSRWGVSVGQCLDALARLSSGPRAPRTRVRLGGDTAAALRGEQRRTAARLLRDAADLGAFDASAQDSPWYGADLSTEQDAVRALEAAQRLSTTTLPALRAQMARTAYAVGLAAAATVAQWGHQIDLLVAVRATLDVFTPAVYERSVADMITATAPNQWREDRQIKMSALERRRWRRQARELLRPGAQPADLHAALVRAQAERVQWQQLATGGGWPRVPAGLAETDAAYQAVLDDLALLDGALRTTARGAGLLTVPLDELTARIDRLAAPQSDGEKLPARVAALGSLRRQGLQDLLADLLARRVPTARVGDELELCWWASVLEHALADSPVRRPGAASTGGYTEALRASRAAAAAAVRDAERARARSSCTVASPLSVPQSVPSGERYDLVVLAGAHQCAVPEAVLAMARGAQLVVVGDPHGLPPAGLDLVHETTTPAASPPDRQGPASRRRSVLEATRGLLPTLRLTHQHRMPAQLVGTCAVQPSWCVPAPGGGVRLELVPDGTGRPDAEEGVESVDAEVRRVVDLVLEHARARPEQSLAVLTITRHHARRVADAVRAELPEHPDAAAFFTRPGPEPFVVTDLPRCEDAVRDAVLLSVGFGQTPRGRVLHRFGPLDGDGGERLLHAGATRARHALTVVSCFGAGDLDPDKLKTPGARALGSLLALAAQGWDGLTSGTVPPGRDGGKLDPLLDDLAKRLHDVDLEVEPGGARPGWPDLAVGSPDGAPVAVLTDARWEPDADPDRMCELVADDLSVAEHLRRFGWRVVSVSSLDLFTDAEAAVTAVVRAGGGRRQGTAPREDVPAEEVQAEEVQA